MKIVVLDGIVANPGDLSWDKIKSLGDFVLYDRSDISQVEERAKDADIVIVNKVVLNRETLSKLTNLKMIALLSTGYNIIDLDYTNEKGIVVCNVPAYSTPSVAQLTFAFILELTMGVGLHSERVKNGEWSSCQDFCFWSQSIIELKNKTIGIIGLGSIGLEVAKIANSFSMNVLGYSRNKKENLENIKQVELDELLKNSDIISFHCPLNKESQGMLNKDLIDKMKDGVFVINTARGSITNEKDVYNALVTKKMSGYAADVLCDEPPKTPSILFKAPNCYITPHMAWASIDARSRLLEAVYLNIKGFLENKIQNRVEK